MMRLRPVNAAVNVHAHVFRSAVDASHRVVTPCAPTLGATPKRSDDPDRFRHCHAIPATRKTIASDQRPFSWVLAIGGDVSPGLTGSTLTSPPRCRAAQRDLRRPLEQGRRAAPRTHRPLERAAPGRHPDRERVRPRKRSRHSICHSPRPEGPSREAEPYADQRSPLTGSNRRPSPNHEQDARPPRYIRAGPRLSAAALVRWDPGRLRCFLLYGL